jgi:hypothetical protein
MDFILEFTAGYRDVAEHTLDLRALGPLVAARDGLTLLFIPDRNCILSRGAESPFKSSGIFVERTIRWSGNDIIQPLVRAKISLVGGGVSIRTSYYPTAAIPLLVSLSGLAIEVRAPWLGIVALLVAGMIVATGASVVRRHAEAIEHELSDRLLNRGT